MTDTAATLGRDLGRMLQAFSLMPAVTVVVALAWGEYWAIPALLASSALPLAVGTAAAWRFRAAEEPGKLHGMLIAASGWFLVAGFGSLPFFLVAASMRYGVLGAPAPSDTVAAFLRPLNAFFESMSGFTGTGLTMAVNEERLPRVLQWWRSFIEWVGGVGVIVLTTAILARPGSGSLTLYESEARSEKIHPSVVSTVRTIWWIFLLFTFLSILALWLAGMPLWGAINHAMTALSTGGFSITNNSIATYDSALIDYTLWPIMILGSIAFPVHYLVLQGDLGKLYGDLQTRWLWGYFGLGVVALTGLLVLHGTYDSVAAALRYGGFQFISAATCTGFQTAGDLGTRWSALSQLTVAVGMFVGGAAGSTVGGIKLIRVITFVKGARFRVQNIFYPESAVRLFRLGDRTLTRTEAAREFEEAAIISFLWLVFLAAGGAVLLLTVDSSYTLQNVIFEVASAQGNVGLSTGITGPGMPTPAKVVFLFNMWIGRLEIIPVLVLLRAGFKGVGAYR